MADFTPAGNPFLPARRPATAGPMLPSTVGPNRAALGSVLRQEESPSVFESLFRFLGRPAFVVRNLMTGNLQGAFRNSAQFFQEFALPLGIVNPKFNLTNTLSWVGGPGVTDLSREKDRPEFSDVLRTWGVVKNRRALHGWEKFAVDVAGGILTDPLTLVGGGGKFAGMTAKDLAIGSLDDVGRKVAVRKAAGGFGKELTQAMDTNLATWLHVYTGRLARRAVERGTGAAAARRAAGQASEHLDDAVRAFKASGTAGPNLPEALAAFHATAAPGPAGVIGAQRASAVLRSLENKAGVDSILDVLADSGADIRRGRGFMPGSFRGPLAAGDTVEGARAFQAAHAPGTPLIDPVVTRWRQGGDLVHELHSAFGPNPEKFFSVVPRGAVLPDLPLPSGRTITEQIQAGAVRRQTLPFLDDSLEVLYSRDNQIVANRVLYELEQASNALSPFRRGVIAPPPPANFTPASHLHRALSAFRDLGYDDLFTHRLLRDQFEGSFPAEVNALLSSTDEVIRLGNTAPTSIPGQAIQALLKRGMAPGGGFSFTPLWSDTLGRAGERLTGWTYRPKFNPVTGKESAGFVYVPWSTLGDMTLPGMISKMAHEMNWKGPLFVEQQLGRGANWLTRNLYDKFTFGKHAFTDSETYARAADAVENGVRKLKVGYEAAVNRLPIAVREAMSGLGDGVDGSEVAETMTRVQHQKEQDYHRVMHAMWRERTGTPRPPGQPGPASALFERDTLVPALRAMADPTNEHSPLPNIRTGYRHARRILDNIDQRDAAANSARADLAAAEADVNRLFSQARQVDALGPVLATAQDFQAQAARARARIAQWPALRTTLDRPLRELEEGAALEDYLRRLSVWQPDNVPTNLVHVLDEIDHIRNTYPNISGGALGIRQDLLDALHLIWDGDPAAAAAFRARPRPAAPAGAPPFHVFMDPRFPELAADDPVVEWLRDRYRDIQNEVNPAIGEARRARMTARRDIEQALGSIGPAFRPLSPLEQGNGAARRFLDERVAQLLAEESATSERGRLAALERLFARARAAGVPSAHDWTPDRLDEIRQRLMAEPALRQTEADTFRNALSTVEEPFRAQFHDLLEENAGRLFVGMLTKEMIDEVAAAHPRVSRDAIEKAVRFSHESMRRVAAYQRFGAKNTGDLVHAVTPLTPAWPTLEQANPFYLPHQLDPRLVEALGRRDLTPKQVSSLQSVFDSRREYETIDLFMEEATRLADTLGIDASDVTEVVQHDYRALTLQRLLAFERTKFANEAHQEVVRIAGKLGGPLGVYEDYLAGALHGVDPKTRNPILRFMSGGPLSFDVSQPMDKSIDFLNRSFDNDSFVTQRQLGSGRFRITMNWPGLNALYKPLLTSSPPGFRFRFRNNVSSPFQLMLHPDVGPVGMKSFLDILRNDGMVRWGVRQFGGEGAWKAPLSSTSKALPDSAILSAMDDEQRVAWATQTFTRAVTAPNEAERVLTRQALEQFHDLKIGPYTFKEAFGILDSVAGPRMTTRADLADGIDNLAELLGLINKPMHHDPNLMGKFVRTFRKFVDFGQEMAGESETQWRVLGALEFMRQGKSPVEVVSQVNRMFVDYSRNSELEGWIRGFIPFARYMIGSTGWLKDIVANPSGAGKGLVGRFGSMQGLGTVSRALTSPGTDGTEASPMVPSYVKETLALPLPWLDKEGNQAFLVSLGFPHEVVVNMLSLVSGRPESIRRVALGSLQPAVKTPLEAMLGRTFYFGTEFGSYRKAPWWAEHTIATEVPGPDGTTRYEVPGTLNEVLNAFPTAGMESTLNRLSDDRRSIAGRLVNAMTGFQVQSVDQEAELQRRISDYLREQVRSGAVGELKVFFERLRPEDVPEDVRMVLDQLEKIRAEKRRKKERK